MQLKNLRSTLNRAGQFFSVKIPGTIEFVCAEEDKDVIPAPFRASKHMPDWFKNLPQKINNEDRLENSTIKRCMPFIDAMSAGWIIPLAADVEFSTNEDGSAIQWKHNFYKSMVEKHSQEQVAGNPKSPRPPLKFMNYWLTKIPPGWSLAFVPPLNRPDPRFECISGIVHSGYHEYVNFPFFFTEDKFTGIIKAGTPLVQCIPIPSSSLSANIGVFSKKDIDDLALTRKKRQSHESYYRDVVRPKAKE